MTDGKLNYIVSYSKFYNKYLINIFELWKIILFQFYRSYSNGYHSSSLGNLFYIINHISSSTSHKKRRNTETLVDLF